MLELLEKKDSIKEYQVMNNNMPELEIINLPAGWWYSVTTIDAGENNSKQKPLEIIPLHNSTNFCKSSAVPKVSYWEISQGDYKVKEIYKEFKDTRKMRAVFNRISLGLTIITASYFVILFSKILSKF
jgi:hypothetical protein